MMLTFRFVAARTADDIKNEGSMEMNDAVGKVGDMQEIPGQAFIYDFLRIRIYRCE